MIKIHEIDMRYRLHHKGLKHWIKAYNNQIEDSYEKLEFLLKAKRCTQLLLQLIARSPDFKADESKARKAFKLSKINYKRVKAEWDAKMDISG